MTSMGLIRCCNNPHRVDIDVRIDESASSVQCGGDMSSSSSTIPLYICLLYAVRSQFFVTIEFYVGYTTNFLPIGNSAWKWREKNTHNSQWLFRLSHLHSCMFRSARFAALRHQLYMCAFVIQTEERDR